MKALITESIRGRLLEKWVVDNFSDLEKKWDERGFYDYVRNDGTIMFFTTSDDSEVVITIGPDDISFTTPKLMLGFSDDEILNVIGQFIRKTYGIEFSKIEQL